MTEKEMQNQILYWKKNPDKFAEWILGYKLPWYKKLWFKLFSNIKNDNKSIHLLNRSSPSTNIIFSP